MTQHDRKLRKMRTTVRRARRAIEKSDEATDLVWINTANARFEIWKVLGAENTAVDGVREELQEISEALSAAGKTIKAQRDRMQTICDLMGVTK